MEVFLCKGFASSPIYDILQQKNRHRSGHSGRMSLSTAKYPVLPKKYFPVWEAGLHPIVLPVFWLRGPPRCGKSCLLIRLQQCAFYEGISVVGFEIEITSMGWTSLLSFQLI